MYLSLAAFCFSGLALFVAVWAWVLGLDGRTRWRRVDAFNKDREQAQRQRLSALMGRKR